MTTKKYPVRGMSCASCSAHVDKALHGVEGVNEVNVNLATNTAKISYDETVCSPTDLAEAVSRMGFELLINEEITEASSSQSSSSAEAAAQTEGCDELKRMGRFSRGCAFINIEFSATFVRGTRGSSLLLSIILFI